MTIKRKNNAQCPQCGVDGICPLCKEPIPGATEFSEWLRLQPEIDSSLGFITTNIDYMWRNYNTGQWMLIEEKRRNVEIKEWQRTMFRIVNAVCKLDENYKGFHIITFENTSPDDGKITLDRKEVSRDELIKFLRFELEIKE